MSRRKRQIHRMKNYLDSKKKEIIRDEIVDYSSLDNKDHPIEMNLNLDEKRIAVPTISSNPLE